MPNLSAALARCLKHTIDELAGRATEALAFTSVEVAHGGGGLGVGDVHLEGQAVAQDDLMQQQVDGIGRSDADAAEDFLSAGFHFIIDAGVD